MHLLVFLLLGFFSTAALAATELQENPYEQRLRSLARGVYDRLKQNPILIENAQHHGKCEEGPCENHYLFLGYQLPDSEEQIEVVNEDNHHNIPNGPLIWVIGRREGCERESKTNWNIGNGFIYNHHGGKHSSHVTDEFPQAGPFGVLAFPNNQLAIRWGFVKTGGLIQTFDARGVVTEEEYLQHALAVPGVLRIPMDELQDLGREPTLNAVRNRVEVAGHDSTIHVRNATNREPEYLKCGLDFWLMVVPPIYGKYPELKGVLAEAIDGFSFYVGYISGNYKDLGKEIAKLLFPNSDYDKERVYDCAKSFLKGIATFGLKLERGAEFRADVDNIIINGVLGRLRLALTGSPISRTDEAIIADIEENWVESIMMQPQFADFIEGIAEQIKNYLKKEIDEALAKSDLDEDIANVLRKCSKKLENYSKGKRLYYLFMIAIKESAKKAVRADVCSRQEIDDAIKQRIEAALEKKEEPQETTLDLGPFENCTKRTQEHLERVTRSLKARHAIDEVLMIYSVGYLLEKVHALGALYFDSKEHWDKVVKKTEKYLPEVAQQLQSNSASEAMG